MPRLFVANLHFEQQIAGERQILPAALQRRAAEQAIAWVSVAQAGDVIWCPQPVASDFWRQMRELGLPLISGASRQDEVPPGLELMPWGWSEAVRRWGRTVGALCDAPPPAAVRACNSRRFSLELERRRGVGIDGAVAVASPDELERVLGGIAPHQRWVAKAEFGAAARQRLVCTGPYPDRNSAGWLRKRLAAGECLVFEPWVERVAEAGLQWTIPRSGPPVLEGVTGLLSDSIGQYVGSRFGLSAAEIAAWQPAIDIAGRAVRELQQAGYFGPVGIDSMRYRAPDGTVRIRPLQDINARWTMGRLALEWQRVMPAGIWRHGTADEFVARHQINTGMIRTSPETVGDSPAQTASWLEQSVVV